MRPEGAFVQTWLSVSKHQRFSIATGSLEKPAAKDNLFSDSLYFSSCAAGEENEPISTSLALKRQSENRGRG